jgi:hypothetical protein
VDMAYFRKYRKAVITDVYLIKQKNSGTMTEFDDVAYAEFIHTWESEGKDPKSLCAWIHSHVNMDAFWSGTDDANIRRLTDILPIVVSVVTNKRCEAKGRIDFGGIFKTELPASVCLWRSQPAHSEDALALLESAYERCAMERYTGTASEFTSLRDFPGADGAEQCNDWEPGSPASLEVSSSDGRRNDSYSERGICLDERQSSQKRHITRNKKKTQTINNTYSEADVHLAFLSELASELTTDAAFVEDAITAIGVDAFAVRTGIEGIERTCEQINDRLNRYELGEAQDSLFEQEEYREQRHMSGPPVGSCSRIGPTGTEKELTPITLIS